MPVPRTAVTAALKGSSIKAAAICPGDFSVGYTLEEARQPRRRRDADDDRRAGEAQSPAANRAARIVKRRSVSRRC
jgi:hypothetical protein